MHTLTRKPVGWFKPDPNQPRKQFDDAELRQLGESLKVRQLQPVLARPDGTLIAGERRLRAALLVGLSELDVIITNEPLDDTRVEVIQLTENIQRQDLSDIELYLGCKSLLAKNPTWKRVDLAAQLQKGPSWVTRHLSPDDVIAPVREQFLAGRLGIGHVYAIAKVPQEQQAEALALRLNGKATRDDLEAHGRKVRNGQRQTVKKSRCKLVLPSVTVTVTVTGSEMDIAGLLEHLQAVTDAVRKGDKANLSIDSLERVMRDKAKKGVSRE